MFDIFVSYRRSDSRADAGRLYDRLSSHFGDDDVFMDIDDIESGQDFVDVLARTLDHCGAMLVVIGKNWLGQPAASGQRRLDNNDDFVRIEIQRAIDRGIAIFPVLVGGATMPDVKDLPDALSALGRFQAHDISDSRFHQDVDRLIAGLEAYASGRGTTKRTRKHRTVAVAAVALIAVVAGGVLWQEHRSQQAAVAQLVAVGDQHSDADDLAAAADAYRQAIALDEDNTLAWRRLVRADREGLARAWIADGRPLRTISKSFRNHIAATADEERRETALRSIFSLRALDSSLDEVDLLRAEAGVYTASLTDAARAVPLLERAHAAAPARADVLAELGLLKAMLADDQDGIDLIRTAVKIEPDDSRWLFYLGESLSAHYKCHSAGDDTAVNGEAAGCAEAIRVYHEAYDLAADDDFWSRHVRYYCVDGALSIFHRYANKENTLLTDNLDMPIDERIRQISFFMPLENTVSRNGWHDYPEYWLATLYDASGEPGKAAAQLQSLLKDKGERALGWLGLYEKVLRQLDNDDEELARVQALLQDAP